MTDRLEAWSRRSTVFPIGEREAAHLGLHLNHHKTELICMESAGGRLLEETPDLYKVNPRDAVPLGSPIKDHGAIDIEFV